jgi:cold shock protein
MPFIKEIRSDVLVQSMGDISYGVVNWFDDERGYGFVTPAHGGRDVFVDASDVSPTGCLHAGLAVSYFAGGTRHWPKAETVHAL